MRSYIGAMLATVAAFGVCAPLAAAEAEENGAEAAAAEAGDDAGLPQILVTARRRAEDAQTVPAALSVVGGALLDKSYTVNTAQLSQLVPSLNYSSANPRNTAFTIRRPRKQRRRRQPGQ